LEGTSLVLRGFKGFPTSTPIEIDVKCEKTRVRPLQRPWYPLTSLEKSQNPESEKKNSNFHHVHAHQNEIPDDLKRLKTPSDSFPITRIHPDTNFGCFRGRQMPGKVVLVE
jgi:hypothetical protein